MGANKWASVGDRAGIQGAEIDPTSLIHVTNMTVQEAESHFAQSEILQIKKEFEKNSKD